MARTPGTYFDEPDSTITTVHYEGLVWVWFCLCILRAVDGVELLLILLFDHRFLHCLEWWRSTKSYSPGLS